MPKIISHLANRGLIITERGKSGGIRLVRRPEEISIYEVVEAIDDHPLLNICMTGANECPLNTRCKVYDMGEKDQECLDASLREIHLGEVEGPCSGGDENLSGEGS